MIRLQTLARIILIALGLYACMRLLGMIPGSFYGLFQVRGDDLLTALVVLFIPLVFVLVFIALAIKFLILESNRWAQRLVGTEPGPEEFPALPWLTVAFRLVCVGVGIYFSVSIIWSLGAALNWSHHFYAATTREKQGGVLAFFLSRNLNNLLCIPLCIYLLYGAPHFVRWQVKKTCELCQSDH